MSHLQGTEGALRHGLQSVPRQQQLGQRPFQAGEGQIGHVEQLVASDLDAPQT